MHHGKSRRGNEIHVKYVKARQFYKIWGRKFCKSRGKEKFPEISRGGKFEICGERLKNGRQKFWWMKIGNFLGKRSNWGNFPGKFSAEIGGKFEMGENASLPQGDRRPCLQLRKILHKYNGDCHLMHNFKEWWRAKQCLPHTGLLIWK